MKLRNISKFRFLPKQDKASQPLRKLFSINLSFDQSVTEVVCMLAKVRRLLNEMSTVETTLCHFAVFSFFCLSTQQLISIMHKPGGKILGEKEMATECHIS